MIRPEGALCPSCNSLVRWKQIDFFGPFACPSCGWSICVSRTYLTMQFVIASIAIGGAAYLVGARGLTWLALFVVGHFPLDIFVGIMMQCYVPPKLHFSQDYMASLRGTDDDSKDHPLRNDHYK